MPIQNTFGMSPAEKTAAAQERSGRTIAKWQIQKAFPVVMKMLNEGKPSGQALYEVSQRYGLGEKGMELMVGLIQNFRAMNEPGFREKLAARTRAEEGLIEKRGEQDRANAVFEATLKKPEGEGKVWGKPYMKDGVYFQKNTQSGKVEKVANIPTGSDPAVKTNRDIETAQKALNMVLSKYDKDLNLMQFMRPDGTVDLSAFQSAAENAYSILEREASKGNMRAQRDLKNVEYWFDRITQLAGGTATTRDPLGLFR